MRGGFSALGGWMIGCIHCKGSHSRTHPRTSRPKPARGPTLVHCKGSHSRTHPRTDRPKPASGPILTIIPRHGSTVTSYSENLRLCDEADVLDVADVHGEELPFCTDAQDIFSTLECPILQ